jgi:capsular polysaccharide transport system permease protein
LDNPLSSILRPGPAAPANEQTPREAPVEGGDAAARRAVEQNSYPPARQIDWTTPQPPQPQAQQPQTQQPLAQQPAHAGRPVLNEIAQPVRTAQVIRPEQVARPEQVVQPVRDDRAQAQPASADDFLAGLEQAAMKDIGADLGGKPASAEPELSDTEKSRLRREKRLAKQATGEAPEKLSREERHEKQDRMLRRKERRAEKKGTALQPALAGKLPEAKADKPARKRDKQARTSTAAPRERGIPWTALSFLVMVLIPAAFATFYYVVLASPQYQVETQFAVRGSGQSSMTTMGLGSLLGGSTAQTGDSYIVISYVESLQLIRDVQQELGIDLRQFYTRDHIDWLYRIEPDMPLEKFTEYWRDMTDVSFNSTTGNTTLYVYAFSAEDSKAIADAVLKVSEKLVNELSESNRRQVMQVASKQVDRAEERLRKVQGEIRKLRVEEKITDPTTLIQLQNQVTSGLQNELTSLKARMTALMKSVNPDAPQAKVLQKQIEAREEQLKMHEAQLGAAIGKDPKDLSPEEKANLAGVLNKFEELTIEQGFATQAYTTALAAFETAIVEAQRQERYFATFVLPTRPEIALFPLRYLDSFIAFLVLLAAWMVTQFLYRSFRDHAI